jgi:hypothetical protein
MRVMRFSLTMQPELGAAVRRASTDAGVSVSGWLEEAAADRLRSQLLSDALDIHRIGRTFRRRAKEC